MKYYEEIFEDIFDGLKFKFNKMNPIDHLNFVLKLPDQEESQVDRSKLFLINVLHNCLWSKDGMNWFPVVEENGDSRLPEFDDNVRIGLILFARFKTKVLMPVFLESKPSLKE